MYTIIGSKNGEKIECSAVVEEKKTKCCSKNNLCLWLLFWFRFEMATAKD